MPSARSAIEQALSDAVLRNFPDANLVVGLATAGISWAHAVAVRLSLPLAYVRSSKKGYGVGGLVEGNPAVNSKAVIIDDVFFSGASVFSAIEALVSEKSIDVVGGTSIITLNGLGVDEYRAKGLNAVSLTNYGQLLAAAVDAGVLSVREAKDMDNYYANSTLVSGALTENG